MIQNDIFCFSSFPKTTRYFFLAGCILYAHLVAVLSITAGDAPSARSNFAFAASPQGAIYLFGGRVSGVYNNQLFVFQPFNNTWRMSVYSGSSWPAGRSYGYLWMAPNGNLYLYGGCGTRKSDAEAYLFSDCFRFTSFFS